MTRHRFLFRTVSVALAVLGVAASGCGGVKVEPREKIPEGEAEIKHLMSLYTDYVAANHKAPANADQLKAYAKKQEPAKLSAIGIENADAAFVSPRDKKPYVVRPLGKTQSPMSVVIYEKDGVEGKRYVAMAQGAVFEAEPDRFKELVPEAR